MASKLSVFNGALRELGERKLSSLAENREPRRVLDSIWDNDAIKTCLAAGLWNFAMRTSMIDYSPSVEPDFGYRRAFDKATDWIRTAAVCEDEYFKCPLLYYNDEAAYIYSDLDTIYVQYVSDGNDYGGDLSNWSPNFVRYVEAWLAARAAMPLTQSTARRDDMERLAEVWLTKAKSTDAMDEPTKFPPPGSWTRARRGRGNSERGIRSRLIG